MDQYIIKGGMSLAGEVTVSGAKNAALGILAAAIMTDEEVLIDNLPDVKDINVMLEAIAQTGVYVDRINRNKVKINASKLDSCVVDDEYIRRIRASYYLIGALLGKYHKAEVALPGGCEIGARPIDQHLKGFRALGANIDISSGRINASSDKLKGAHIFLDIVSVGATINIMLAASLIPGKTVIENVAKEPHIVDVANFLNSMGADIKGAGTDVIRINGVNKLHGTEYSIIPDQIEAGTFMCAAAITRGDITVKNLIPKHMEAISAKLIEIGCEITEFDDAIRVRGAIRQRAANVKTLPYPGFPTDMQPQITAVLARAHGTSTILESIFENRFRYVSELARMGAEIEVKGNMAMVSGVDRLLGANINAPDLRAGAALVIAALAADGISTISDIKYIQRGYEHFEEKLESLGAKIALVDTERAAQKFIFKVS
jgi:UDP-N-acetylglucosamine 1-carboxyvinyltransferase